MTNEQYYWNVRRQQVLRAAAMTQKQNKIFVGFGDNKEEVSTATELGQAFDNMKDGNEITVAKDITITAENPQNTLVVAEDCGITLNLDNTITCEGLPSGDGVLTVKRGGEVTINGNGGIDATSITPASGKCIVALKVTLKDDEESKIAKMTINGGTFKVATDVGESYGITGDGKRNGTDITINNGNIEGKVAIYIPQEGVLTINGGTITGPDCVVVKDGIVTVNGGVLSAFGPYAEYRHYANGWINTGDCFVVEACDYSETGITAKIEGGTFYSENGKPVASYAQDGFEALSGFVYGGSFNKKLDDWLINDTCEQKQVGDMWVVSKKNA